MDFLFGLLMFLAVNFLLWLFAIMPRYDQWKLEDLREYRYAHRGLHNLKRGVPENSLPAFRYAVAGGFGAEIDVHLTKDGRLAVIHDSWLDRLCGKHVRVEDLTLEELRQLRLQGTGEQIPLLEEVLPLFCGKAPLIIELKVEKGNYRELCAAVCKMLQSYRGDYCVESFDPRALYWLRRNEPFIIRGQLSQNFFRSSEIAGVSLPVRALLTLLLSNVMTRPDFVAYQYCDRDLLPMKLYRGLLKGQEVSWTICSQAELDDAELGDAMVIFEKFLPAKRSVAPHPPAARHAKEG